jgi:hypothetical protein
MFKKGLIALIIMIFSVAPVFAAQDAGADAFANAKVSFDVSHSIKDKDLSSGSFTFVLTASDKSYPMPDGSSDGVKKVTIKPGEKFSFGEIKYNKQGFYDYVVSRESVNSKNITEDKSTYKIQVAVFNDGTTAVVFSKDGKTKVDKLEYTDTYVPDKKNNNENKSNNTSTNQVSRSSFKTGDFIPYIVGGVLIVLIIAAVIVYRKRKDQ